MIAYYSALIRTSIPDGIMAKNRAQCQEGLSFLDFQKQSGTEAQCRKTVFRHRWPQGLRGPACDPDGFCLVSVGRYQCPACCHQTSFSAGMICAGTLEDLLPRFVSVAARTLPLPYRPATLAENPG